MDITGFLTDDDAASSVIGVILMVAVAVILAAVIGQFVLGLSDKVNDNAPQAKFDFTTQVEKGDDNVDVNLTEVTVTHTQGTEIADEELDIRVEGAPAFDIEGKRDTPPGAPAASVFQDNVSRILDEGEEFSAGDAVSINAYYTGSDYSDPDRSINDSLCMGYNPNKSFQSTYVASGGSCQFVPGGTPRGTSEIEPIESGDAVAIYWTDPGSDDSAKLSDYQVPKPSGSSGLNLTRT